MYMAVVVGDHEMGITHVLRRDDHVSEHAAPDPDPTRLLGRLCRLFGHVPMILGNDRQNLSKRHGARAVIEYESDGLLPQALVSTWRVQAGPMATRNRSAARR